MTEQHGSSADEALTARGASAESAPAARRAVRIRSRATGLIVPVMLLWAAAWAVPQYWGAASDPLRWVLLAIGASAVLLMICSWLSWRSSVCRITDDTVGLTEGVLRRRLRQVPLDAVTTVELTQSLLQRFWGSGTIRLQAGAQFTLTLRSMPDPTSLREALLEQSAHARGRRDRYQLSALSTQPMPAVASERMVSSNHIASSGAERSQPS